GLEALVPKTEPGVLRGWMKWQVVHLLADALPRRFGEESFAFYGRYLAGRAALGPRWRRCVASTGRAMGEVLGREFVRRRLPGDAAAGATRVIEGVERALVGIVDEGRPWLDDAARAALVERLRTTTNRVGAPEPTRDDP